MTVSQPAYSQSRSDRFESQFQSVRSRAYAQALMLTRNRADADDLLQTTLVKAWSRYDVFDETRSFGKWIGSIMTRAFLDRRRAESRRLKPLSYDAYRGAEDDGYELDFADPSSEDIANGIALRQDLRQALEEMPDIHRRIVLMCDLLGLDYDLCAQREGIPVGTVRSRLFRGRQKLREALSA